MLLPPAAGVLVIVARTTAFCRATPPDKAHLVLNPCHMRNARTQLLTSCTSRREGRALRCATHAPNVWAVGHP